MPQHGHVDRIRTLASEIQHILKYLMIGAAASAIDVSLFLILYNFVHPSELVAHSISVSTALVFSFAINTRHNFKTNDYALFRFVSFVIVCTVGFALGYGVILSVQSFYTDQVSGANVGKVVSLPIVFVIQYGLNSRITFRKVRRTDSVT